MNGAENVHERNDHALKNMLVAVCCAPFEAIQLRGKFPVTSEKS